MQKSMKISLGVSLTNRRWNRYKINNLQSLPLSILEQAAFLTFVEMSNDYRSLVFHFNKPASLATRNCKELFKQATVDQLGTNFKCEFQEGTSLVVKLGPGATVKPGDPVTLLRNTIKSRYQQLFDYTPTTDAIVIAPREPFEVEAIISGTNRLGSCDKLILSGRQSKGAGGRPLEYNWDVEFSSNVDANALNATEQNSVNVIKSLLSALPPYKDTLRYEPSALVLFDGIEYKFKLSVRNFLGISSSTVSHVVKRESKIFPEVTIPGDSTKKIKVNRLTRIETKARIPKCLGSANNALSFLWEIDHGGVILDEKSIRKSNLYIYPGTLKGGQTYLLTLTVSLKSNPLIITTTTVTLHVYQDSIPPIIKGGNRVVSSNQDVVLTGLSAHDRYAKTDPNAWFEWECTDINGVPCFVVDPSNSNQYIRYKLPTTAKVRIKNNTLESNKTYLFTLHYHRYGYFTKTSSKIRIIPSEPPSVTIFAQNILKVNIKKRLQFRGKIKSMTSPTRIWIECLYSNEYAYINISETGVLITPSEITRIKKGFSPFDVVLNRDVLAGGATYMFILKAESSEGLGYAEIILVTNAPPSTGILEVDVLNGTALATSFTFSALQGWEDDADDYPLTYSFGYYISNTKKHYLGVPSESSLLTTYLPRGDPENNNLLVLFVKVFDIQGAFSETTAIVQVNPLESIDVSLIKDISRSVNEAMESDDISSVMRTVVATVAVFQEIEEGAVLVFCC